ncbi:MAG: hypothetical protein KC474_07885 [Cyanobacteria bacterium HKST-UBA04]|nr:hypothetical protein [Cyanobacteria bacterium HKST-UBA04]
MRLFLSPFNPTQPTPLPPPQRFGFAEPNLIGCGLPVDRFVPRHNRPDSTPSRLAFGARPFTYRMTAPTIPVPKRRDPLLPASITHLVCLDFDGVLANPHVIDALKQIQDQAGGHTALMINTSRPLHHIQEGIAEYEGFKALTLPTILSVNEARQLFIKPDGPQQQNVADWVAGLFDHDAEADLKQAIAEQTHWDETVYNHYATQLIDEHQTGPYRLGYITKPNVLRLSKPPSPHASDRTSGQTSDQAPDQAQWDYAETLSDRVLRTLKTQHRIEAETMIEEDDHCLRLWVFPKGVNKSTSLAYVMTNAPNLQHVTVAGDFYNDIALLDADRYEAVRAKAPSRPAMAMVCVNYDKTGRFQALLNGRLTPLDPARLEQVDQGQLAQTLLRHHLPPPPRPADTTDTPVDTG